MFRRHLELAIAIVLVSGCSAEPAPSEQPHGELDITGSSRLVEGVPQRLFLWERRTWESGRVDSKAQWPMRAECPDDACTTQIVGMDLVVTPKRAGRVQLRVVADPGYAEPTRTFDLLVAASRLAIFYDPRESTGARDVVASGTLVSWNLGVTDAAAPNVEPVAISTKPAPVENHIDVLEGDATVTRVDDESLEGIEFDAGVSSGARYEIQFGRPGNVVFDVGLGALRRTLTVEVVDPSTATSLVVHAAQPNATKVYLDVETRADSVLGSPVNDVSLVYPDGRATLVAFLRDDQDRLVECGAADVQLGAPSVVSLVGNGRAHEMTSTRLGSSTIRATLAGQSKDVRVVVR